MNKQEAIEKLKKDSWEYYDSDVLVIDLDDAQDIVSQIDEPQKVTVPKFVAEYIERCKQTGRHLQKVLSGLGDDKKVGDWVYDEYHDLIPEKVDMVAHAWLDGYEIEQEKLYTVRIPNPNRPSIMYSLYRNDDGNIIIIGAGYDYEKREKYQLTESEIKQDFEWAWQWAEEV